MDSLLAVETRGHEGEKNEQAAFTFAEQGSHTPYRHEISFNEGIAQGKVK